MFLMMKIILIAILKVISLRAADFETENVLIPTGFTEVFYGFWFCFNGNILTVRLKKNILWLSLSITEIQELPISFNVKNDKQN